MIPILVLSFIKGLEKLCLRWLKYFHMTVTSSCSAISRRRGQFVDRIYDFFNNLNLAIIMSQVPISEFFRLNLDVTRSQKVIRR